MTNGQHPLPRRRIPPYEPGFIPSGTTAYWDRLKVVGLAGEVTFQNLAALDAHVRHLNGRDVLRAERPLPHLTHSIDDRWHLVIRPGFLLGGRITLRLPRRTRAAMSPTADVYVDLELNPTRFWAQHLQSREAVDDMLAREALRVDLAAAARTHEDTLDQSDNMLPPGHLLWSRSEGVRENTLCIYLSHVTSFIANALAPRRTRMARPAGLYRPAVRFDLRWHQLVLRQCEVYWEWQTPDAVETMADVASRAGELAHSFDSYSVAVLPRSGQRPDRVVIGRLNNVPVLRLHLARSVRLAIYAKAWDRIRFEVRYDRNVAQQISPRPVIATLPQGMARITEIAALATHDAAARVARLFSELHRPRAGMRPQLSNLAQFLTKVARAAGGDLFATYRILLLLLRDGAISARGSGIPRKTFDALVQRGVIRRAHTGRREQHRRYVVADVFRPTANLLRQLMR